MILCFVAAQSVQQLQAVACSCKFLRHSVVKNQSDIVWYAFNLNDSPYYTAGQLYHKLPPYYTPGQLYRKFSLPGNLDLKTLFRVARICDIAKQLAVGLADEHYESPSEPCYDRFVRNVVPYILALGHFFEHYRDGLVSYVPGSGPANDVRRASTRIGNDILVSRYNERTVLRICTLYHLLKDILDRDLDRYDRPCDDGRYCYTETISHQQGTEQNDVFDIFIFLGFDAVKDVMVQKDKRVELVLEPERNSTDGIRLIAPLHDIIENHFARDVPWCFEPWDDDEHLDHPLPPSTRPPLNRDNTEKISGLLPDPSIPGLEALSIGGFPQTPKAQEKATARFYKYLECYNGNDPQLLL